MAREFDHIIDEELRRRREMDYRPGTRIRDIRPADPAVDTFRQRFNPSDDPGRPIEPGRMERFGDPTKVVAQAQTTMTDATQLPPGFKFLDEGPSELPPGFKYLDEKAPAPEAPTPAVNAGISQLPEDPFERAALRTQRSVQPPEGRQEGRFTRAIEGAPAAITQVVGDELARVGRIAEEGFTTGTLSPDKLLEVGMLGTPAPVARATGRAIAQAARPLAERQQLETGVLSIPNAAEGGVVKQAVGRGVSLAPIGGGKLRKTAERSTEELQAAGEAAAARPTGVVPSQNLAGSNVRRGIERAIAASIAEGGEAPRSLVRALGQVSNEDLIGRIAKMASEVKPGANVNTLADLRRVVPARDWANVQGALIDRMGQSAKSGVFEPATWVSNYGNLSDRSKGILFGREGNLRFHLDAIEAVSRRAPSWQQFQRERASLSSRFGAGSLILAGMGFGAATAGPLSVLGTVIPMALVARGLSRPVTAAPIAQWSSAFERVVRSGGGPQAVAAFTVATRNLGNTLGVELDADTFLRGPQNEQPLE